MIIKNLIKCQTYLVEFLFSFNFVIFYILKKKNKEQIY